MNRSRTAPADPVLGAVARLVPGLLLKLPAVARYGIALASTAVAVLLRVLLIPVWGAETRLVTFYAAVTLSSWIGGIGPGLASTLFSALVVNYYWMSPQHTLRVTSPADVATLASFVVVAVLISSLNEAWRRAASALHRSEEKLRVTLASIGDAVMTTDDQGRVSKMNAVAEALTGWAVSDAAGRPLDQILVIVNEDSRQPVQNPADRVLREGVVVGLANHTILLSKDGREIPIDDSAAPIRAVDGTVAGVVIVFRDVTERRRVERERREADERFRLTVEAAPSAMILIDRDGAIQMINALAEQLLGYPRSEIIGRSVELLIPGRFRSDHPELRKGFFSDPRQRPMGSGRDLYALRKDGSEIAVEIGLSPLHTADGPFVLAAVTDITERKRAAALLQAAVQAERAAKRQAVRANELKDQFLATVSHELRGPLNAVLGWAEMLRTGTLTDTRRQQALEAVVVNAKRQAQLINDLLDVARIVSGKLHIESSTVDMSTVIRGALDVVEPAAEQKRLTISVDVDETIGTILGDATRLQQVVWNLLTNAVKFTPEGGSIRLRVTRSSNMIDMVVTDTGQGITPEFLPFVFEPFRQADGSTTRTHGGLGLGLSIVKHLIEAHGGTVSATSSGQGLGSTFTVRLPIVAVYVGEQGTTAAASPVGANAGEASLDGVTVLVVDDDPDSREMVAACLEGRNASVLTAASVPQALTILKEQHVDVLLADIAMPGEDGYALIRQIRSMESPEKAALPAAALTSFTQEGDRQRALDAGFQAHLAKPVESRMLIQAVATMAFRVTSR